MPAAGTSRHTLDVPETGKIMATSDRFGTEVKSDADEERNNKGKTTMSKQCRIAMSAAVLVVAGTALAQSPNITSFQGNGQLTWINSDTNLFYRVEWAPSLTAPDAWHSNYVALIDIRSSASIVTSSVPMFYRVCGSSNRVVYPSPVPKTGQTTLYQSGDDGYYEKGMALPTPRFTVQANTDCVLDNLTGLIWARNANLAGSKTWSQSLTYCEDLTYGGTNDWRLPNDRELKSLTHCCYLTPALGNTAGAGQWTNNDPFTSVQNSHYWSSTTYAPPHTVYAWRVSMENGNMDGLLKSGTCYVWPVRGGQ